jgi:hypothetical protein
MSGATFSLIGHASTIFTILVIVGIGCYLLSLTVEHCLKEDEEHNNYITQSTKPPIEEPPKPQIHEHEVKSERAVKEEGKFEYQPSTYEYKPSTYEYKPSEYGYKPTKEDFHYSQGRPIKPPHYPVREIIYPSPKPKEKTPSSTPSFIEEEYQKLLKEIKAQYNIQDTPRVEEKKPYVPSFIEEDCQRLRTTPQEKIIIPPSPPIQKKAYIPPPPPPPTLRYTVNITGKRNITDNKIFLLLLDKIGFEAVEKMPPKSTIIVEATKTSTTTTKYGGKSKHSYLFSTVETTRENLISLYYSDEAKTHERNKMTSSLRQRIMIRDNYTCQMCGKVMRDTVGLQIDHIIPINKGGKSVEENLQVLCSICNGRKSDKILGG